MQNPERGGHPARQLVCTQKIILLKQAYLQAKDLGIHNKSSLTPLIQWL